MAWLSGYSYCKSITLSRASGAVTNYQMKLLVGESAGATGEDVDCNSHVQIGFHDLRFTKSDGTTLLDYWIESITGTTPNQLATVWIEFDSIGTGATTFYMYYGNATIPDPIDVPTTSRWQRYVSNPVLPVGAGGAWDDWWVGFHSIWKEGDTYYAYYNGRQSGTQLQIGLATSTDGITWTKNGGNPVLAFGAGGQWDDYVVASPMVWKEGSTWYMLYSGARSTGAYQIGLATSSDGISWTRSGSNPVFSGTVSQWDAEFVSPGTTMLKEGSTYYLYYCGDASRASLTTRKIGLATSTDLISWTKSGNNPLLSGVGSGTEYYVDEPSVLKFGSTYYMWYQMTGDDANLNRSRIGLATSANKDSGWTKSGSNPILNNDQDQWDDMWTEVSVIIQVGNEWRMYYNGSKGSGFSPRLQGGYAIHKRSGSGSDTFLLFDEFRGSTIDTGVWNNTGTFAQDKDNVKKYAANTNVNYMLLSQNQFTAPLAIESKCKVGADWANEYGVALAIAHDTAWASTGYWGFQYKDASNDYKKVAKFGTGAAGQQTNESITAGTWYRFSLRVGSTTQKLLVDNAEKGSISTSIQTNPANIIIGTGRPSATADYTIYHDWIAVRNYVDTEPAWGSWGAEESGDTGAFFLLF
jgi:predicted GH43/DUF377 family glycosyl hydrolase